MCIVVHYVHGHQIINLTNLTFYAVATFYLSCFFPVCDMSVHMFVFVHLCVCVWKLEVDVECLPQFLSMLLLLWLFEPESLTGPEAPPFS